MKIFNPDLITKFPAALLWLALGSWGYALTQTVQSPSPVNRSDPKVIAAGSTIFAGSCSVGYCHGKEGRAGRGPRLRGKAWDKEYLFNVILEGIPNSSMPAWKNKLSEKEIWEVVAYIMTLSKLTSDSTEAPAPTATTASSEEASIGTESKRASQLQKPIFDPGSSEITAIVGDPEKGKALFFDSNNDFNCGMCHKVQGVGNGVGPDLSTAKEKAARELFKDIVLPSAVISPEQRLWRIRTKSGEQIEALKVAENDVEIQLYDVGSLPPVLRTLSKREIEKRQVADRSAMPGKYGELYTLKQLLDIIAFLKSGDSPGSTRVSMKDLF
jgi:putative heme-binding domain-containing protein